MFTVHGTKKFLDRAPSPVVPAAGLQPSTTTLGAWYGTVLFWKRHVALFVNESTLLPLFVPLAPTATVLARMPLAVAAALASLGLDQRLITREITEMGTHQLTKTANRSVLGSMNDFAYLAAHRGTDNTADLNELSLRLASTPCSPLYGSHVSPDREVIAFLNKHPG